MYTLSRQADAVGKFQVPGAFGFSIEPDPAAAAPAAGWALTVARNQSGELPLVVTGARSHFFPKAFDRLEIVGAAAASRWLVTLFEEGEYVTPPGGSGVGVSATAAEIAAAIVAADSSARAPVLLFSETANLFPKYGLWFGPDGIPTTLAGADCFDATAYRRISMTLSGTLTGGSAPTSNLLVYEFDAYAPGTGLGALNQVTVGSTAGPITADFGETNTFLTVGAGYSGVTANAFRRLRHFKIGLSSSGSPTGITNGRLFVWGCR